MKASAENADGINLVAALILAFCGLPGGYRNNNNGNYNNMGNNGYFWSSSENNTNNAWKRKLNYNNDDINRNNNNKQNGFSVRCLQDYIKNRKLPVAVISHYHSYRLILY